MAGGGVGGGAREQWEQQPPTTLPFLPWEVGQGGGRGEGGWETKRGVRERVFGV